jgi:hypothetical protein
MQMSTIGNAAFDSSRLRLAPDELPTDALQLPGHPDLTPVEVDVSPGQPPHLTPAHAHRDDEHKRGVPGVTPRAGRLRELASVLWSRPPWYGSRTR